MNGKKVLITGANGLVGNYMVQKCIDRGAFVTAVDIHEPTNQLEKYKDEIFELRKFYAHEKLDTLILKRIPNLNNSKLFIILCNFLCCHHE